MKIIRNTQITEITHDELVELFSCALEGSNYLEAEYNKEFYNSLTRNQTTGDCFEDKIADTLLNGGEIYLYDNYSEGELYGGRGEIIENNVGMYVITLADVIEGLEKAANGKYAVSNDEEFAREAFCSFSDEFKEDFDYYYADALMQIIMFNEIIYG